MKHTNTKPSVRTALTLALILHFTFSILNSPAAVPLKWTVETSRVQTAVFDAYHGESLALEAALQSYGKPLEIPLEGDWKIYWQTNGMADAWWSAPATVKETEPPSSTSTSNLNLLTATFTPEMDPGAPVVNGFIGSPGNNYRAAFTIRFRHAPGATPNAITKPVPILDLANTTVINAPWPTDETIKGIVTNTVTKTFVESLGISTDVTPEGIGAATAPNDGYHYMELSDNTYETYDCPTFLSGLYAGEYGARFGVTYSEGHLYDYDGYKWYYGEDEIAVKGDIDSAINPIEATASEASIWAQNVYRYMTANTNAWFAGTNYVLGADAEARTHFSWEDGMDATTVPCSMALWERRDGQKQVVWDQRDWVSWYWSFKARQLRGEIAATNAAIYAAIASPENHAWARRYAATGRENPDRSTTFVDTPRVCLSPGMTWETVAEVGGCGYWTIVGNGALIGGSGTNATLMVRDFEGNEIMTITKGEHRLAWLESSDFVGQMTDADGWICFDMRSDVQPVGYFSTTLDAEDFTAETEAGCPARFRWEDIGGGVWRVHFILKPGIVSPSCFAKFQYEVQGASEVRYKAGLVVEGGLMINGKKIAPVVPDNAAVGDTIIWKVVR